MNIEQRKKTIVHWGKVMRLFGDNAPWPGFESGLNQSEYEMFNDLIDRMQSLNPWFTAAFVRLSLKGFGEALQPEKVDKWLAEYEISEPAQPKKVLIVMAGNIPMVGFHDMLCVLVSGHIAMAKLSSDDNRLLPMLIDLFAKISPELTSNIVFVEGRNKEFDAVIATGSDNTSRYFHHYFGAYPNIIRRNRNSVAILSGEETKEELAALGKDVFNYFGLGCRSVAKIYIPRDFKLDHFFESIIGFGDVINHHKYANNYDYNKAVWLLNQTELLDNGFILLKEDEGLTSPTGALYYERYDDLMSLREKLMGLNASLQCIVSKEDIPFGGSQQPELWDYADDVDTLAFLTSRV